MFTENKILFKLLSLLLSVKQKRKSKYIIFVYTGKKKLMEKLFLFYLSISNIEGDEFNPIRRFSFFGASTQKKKYMQKFL